MIAQGCFETTVADGLNLQDMFRAFLTLSAIPPPGVWGLHFSVFLVVWQASAFTVSSTGDLPKPHF